METINGEVGRKLRMLRKARGLTQQELAEIVHIDYSTISLIETGKKDIKLSVIERLVTGLEAELEVKIIG